MTDNKPDRQVSFHHETLEVDGASNNRLNVVKGLSFERINSQDQELEEELQEAGLITPPDGGYGWLIVFGSFLANVVVDGINFTAGQSFVKEWEGYYNATSGETAWSVSLLTGCYLLVGPFASILANFYGCRVVTALGTIIAIIGFICTIFAPSLPILLLTFGVCGGIGFGLIYLPAVVIVSYYFQKRRALATGIAVCGSGIGMFTFAPMLGYLIKVIDWKGTMAVVAAMTSTGFLCALIFKPLKPSDEQVEKVAEIAVNHAINLSKENISGQDEKVMRVQSMLAQNSVDEAPMSPIEKLISSDAQYSQGTGKHEKTKSPHVAGALEIERFTDEDPKQLRHRINRRASRHTVQTPFKSALELRAKANTNLQGGRASAADIFRLASKEAVQSLNKPLSRIDIFYTGSTMSLEKRHKDTMHSDSAPGAATPRRSMLALSRASIYEMASEEPEFTLTDNIKAILLTMLDVKLLKSASFLLLAISGFLTMCGFFVPFMFLSRAAQSHGVEEKMASLLVSIIGIVNIVARVVCGWLSDHPKIDALMVHNIALTVGGLATVAVPFLFQFWQYTLYCIFFGFATAVFASLRSIICVELLGLERLTNAFGFLMLFMGVASLVGAPIAGTLYDMTNSYDLTFYSMGVCIAVSGVLGFPLRSINRWERRRNGELEQDDQNVPLNNDDNNIDMGKYYVDDK